MSNPNETLINLYVRNRKSLSAALNSAGGNAEIILNQPEWEMVMFTLATNNIVIDAKKEKKT